MWFAWAGLSAFRGRRSIGSSRREQLPRSRHESYEHTREYFDLERWTRDHAQLLVLLAIANHANDEGYCWPSVETLAAKTRYTERHVVRVIQALEHDGWLQINRQRGKFNRYAIDLKRLLKMSRDGMSGDILSGDIRGQSQVTSATGSGDICAIPSIRTVNRTVNEP